MEYSSEKRIKRAVSEINKIIHGDDNNIILLDFSHYFCFTPKKEEAIDVYLFGINNFISRYSDLLLQAYENQGYYKFTPGTHFYYKLSYNQINSTDKPEYVYRKQDELCCFSAPVIAKNKKIIGWLDYLLEIQFAGSGIVFAKGISHMQSVIFLFFKKNITDDNIIRLMKIYKILDNLLTEEMMEVAYKRYLLVRGSLILASEIQNSIFPSDDDSSKIPGFDIAGINRPSKVISGDYFDYFQVRDEKYALLICDVEGEDIYAALLVFALYTLFRTLLKSDKSLETVIIEANEFMCPMKNATAFISILDTQTGKLEFVNAGHPSPILQNNDKCSELQADGYLMLGAGKKDLFNIGKINGITLREGERLLFFTDGISLARKKNAPDKWFCEDSRIENILKKNKDESPINTLQNLFNALAKWCGVPNTKNIFPHDDCTAVILSRRKKS